MSYWNFPDPEFQSCFQAHNHSLDGRIKFELEIPGPGTPPSIAFEIAPQRQPQDCLPLPYALDKRVYTIARPLSPQGPATLGNGISENFKRIKCLCHILEYPCYIHE